MKDDDLYFSFEDEEEPEEADTAVEAEETSNRTFVIVAAILGAFFILGLAVIGFLVLRGRPSQPAISENELTNQANATLFMATQTASFLTQSAPTPTATPEPQRATKTPQPPTATPTTMVEVTPVTEEGAAGTEVAEVTGTPAEGGAGIGVETPTALVEVTVPPTSAIIEVTPLGATPGGGETPQPTGVGGPIEPTASQAATALPTTGFTGGAGLAGAGILALALVAVVVIVRRLRLK